MKPYEIIFEDRIQYLYVSVSGEQDNYNISKQYWTEITDHIKTTNHTKLLVEESLEETVSMEEMFRLVSEFPEMGLSNVKVAFADLKLDQLLSNQLGGLIAKNLGFKAEIFNNVHDAEVWLLDKSTD
jgi:hypothetical protein